MLHRSAASFVICLIAATQGFANPQTSVPPSDEVYRSGNGVTAPILLKEVKPQYTAEAMRAKIEGSVVMECVVQSDGTVRDDIKVIRSLDRKYGLDDEAVKSARQWTFKPGMKDGKAVPVQITIEIAFTTSMKKRGGKTATR